MEHGCRGQKINEADEMRIRKRDFMLTLGQSCPNPRNPIFQLDLFIHMGIRDDGIGHQVFMNTRFHPLFNARMQGMTQNQCVIRLI